MSAISRKSSDVLFPSAQNYSDIDSLLKREDITCPNCGAKIDHDVFICWMSTDDLTFEVRYNKSNDKYIINHIKFKNIDYKLIRCLSCNYINEKEFFKQENNQFIAQIKKIDKEYSVLKHKNKVFYVQTNIIPRNIQESDSVVIKGILFNQISNGQKIDDDLIIRKVVDDE